jgi:hypothetical protein
MAVWYTSVWYSVVLVVLLAGCGRERFGSGAIGILSEGVINDPSNKSLRFDLLKFGLEQFCLEMQRRGLALKMRDGDPNIGRFGATSCQSQILDEPNRQTILIRYSGKGFGWTNLTQRIGFESQGLIEYAPDFRMQGDAMYIYFRPRNVEAATFRTTLVESDVARTGMTLTGVQPDEIGKQILDAQLRRGFTVVRYSERGESEIGMGLIPLGQHPFRPFQIRQTERITLDNDRTEVHAGQQDFIGGIVVDEDEQALFITATVDGAAAVDLLLLPQAQAATLLSNYTTVRGPTTPSSAPYAAVVQAGQTLQQYIPLPKGTYSLLVDHSTAVGSVAPPVIALDDRAARLDYLIQVGSLK